MGKISVLALSLLNTDPRPAMPPESILGKGCRAATDCRPFGKLFHSLDFRVFLCVKDEEEVCG